MDNTSTPTPIDLNLDPDLITPQGVPPTSPAQPTMTNHLIDITPPSAGETPDSPPVSELEPTGVHLTDLATSPVTPTAPIAPVAPPMQETPAPVNPLFEDPNQVKVLE